ncbi:MAG: signal peptidase I [Phascolarctobacterium sp.]|nr:signal peptidase I [Candidatus Phascolarctobacterium caballi]
MAYTREKPKSTWKDTLGDWITSIIVAGALAFCIRTFLVELYVVEGNSMHPSLLHRERLVVDKFTSFFKLPERGQIIVFRFPKDETRDFIKRVIAVEGDTVEMVDGKVYVNGKRLLEDYIWKEDPMGKNMSSYPKSIVPKDCVFVLGDNRNNSEDSRYDDVGFVPKSLIKGRAMVIFWPLGNGRLLPAMTSYK